MNKQFARALTAVSLVAAACGARAEEVMVSGWAYGAGNDVLAGTAAARYSGPAGALAGSLGGAAVHDSGPFKTYSVELGEAPGFQTVAPAQYQLVGGAQYFLTRRGDAAIAERLGRLMTYAYDNPGLVQSAGGSTALQLAIWNVVYDTDYTVTADPRSSRSKVARFSDSSIYQGAANTLLAGARTVLDSKVRIFVLERAGSADLLLNPLADPNVPEPGSLLLAASALAASTVVRRRRAEGAFK